MHPILSKKNLSLLTLGTSTIVFTLFPNYEARSQIIPDNSLGSENSIIRDNIIDGGAIRGSNLFHSFQDFNINEGQAAYFLNPAGIENIFNRVTGGNVSNILGKLGVLGNANLFLINPNGIIFGANARLDLRGSFISSTADGLLFNNGVEFSASTPENTPLLTINVPIGLQFGQNPGNLINRSIAVDSNANPVGLQVDAGKTLALVGGNLLLEGGNVNAAQGRIELGSIAGESLVGINPDNFSLNYQNIRNFQDIQLSEKAIASVSGPGGGNIRVRGRQITLTGGAQIEANTLGGQPGGSLIVNASESIAIIGRLADGTPSALQTRVEGVATGTGGDLTVTATRLRIAGGARVAASSLSENGGDGGNLTIRASESVELIGAGQFVDGTTAPSQLSAVTTGQGNGGNIIIETGQLIAQDGGQVTSETFGDANAGSVTVNAAIADFIARSADDTEPSGVLTRVELGARGNAGNLTLNVGRLNVQGGARVTASSLGEGNAGNLTIWANDRVEVIGAIALADGSPNTNNPSQISALTTGAGNGGNLTIVSPRVTTTAGGQVVASTFGSGDTGTLAVTADRVLLIGRSADNSRPSGVLARVEVEEATGNANNITVVTRRLQLAEGARLAAASRGQGNAGNILVQGSELLEVTGGGEISVRGLSRGNPGNLTIQGIPGVGTADIRLNNQGSLAASSETGRGGSITLIGRDIQLLRQSDILATGSQSGNPTLEGNVVIQGDILLLLDRSFLGTDADNPQGGSNVNIDALTTFVSPDSTIVAAGDLTLETELEVDPSEVLEVTAIDPNQLIAQNPCKQGVESEFIVTGRGGLPSTPSDPLMSENIAVDLIEIIPPSEPSENLSTLQSSPTTFDNDSEIISAQGWILDENGNVILTAFPNQIPCSQP